MMVKGSTPDENRKEAKSSFAQIHSGSGVSRLQDEEE
jgi:hypothetical protein